MKKSNDTLDLMRQLMHEFSKKLLRHPDRGEAVKLASDQAGLVFDEFHGEEHSQDRIRLEDVAGAHTASSTKVESTRKKLKSTDQYVPSSTVNSASEDRVVKFRDWQGKDQVTIVLTGLLAIFGSYLGAANVYANLMSSGEPIFLDTPSIAISLSMLVPLCAFAVKWVTVFFPYDAHRRIYALSVYLLTLIVLALWTVLFSQAFTGVGGGFDLDSLTEENGSGSLLVWSQLVLEILATASLWLAADRIWVKYAPNYYQQNLAWTEAKAAYDAAIKEHDPILTDFATLTAKVDKNMAARAAFINSALVEFLDLLARFSAANDNDFK